MFENGIVERRIGATRELAQNPEVAVGDHDQPGETSPRTGARTRSGQRRRR